jgi:chorismate dehydratase
VAFINAWPLVEGLDRDPRVRLETAVPSRLLGRLRSRDADVALLPVIDLQREPGLRILPAGGIGCDGETLTVRLFARVPLDQVHTVACDPDSHTSVALSRVIFRGRFGFDPRQVPLDSPEGREAQARLLIGDKVVCEPPVGFEHQLDLGAAWRELTDLPFVFAVWTARAGVETGDLPTRLAAARERGLDPVALDRIVERHAVPRGWPADLAMRYFTHHLRYDIGPRQLEAIACFHDLAAQAGAIPRPPREIPVIGSD